MEKRGIITSLELLVTLSMDAAQDAVGFLQIHIAGLFRASCQTTSPSPSLPQAALSLSAQPVFVLRIAPTPNLTLGLVVLEDTRPPSQACQSFWMASLPSGVLTTPHYLVSLANVLRDDHITNKNI